MTAAITTLMNEHRTIERVLDALDRFVDAPNANPAKLAEFVDFIAGYADKLHHGKEEDVLFEAMIAAGFPREGGPVAVMLFEHEEGRAMVRALRDQSGKPSWSDTDRRLVKRTANDFSQLLRQHIAKEDQILYPMARERLSPEILAEVDSECARVDAGSDDRERLEALAAALTAS